MTSVSTEIYPLSRLKPAEWNPRTIEDVNFRRLMTAIRTDPDFMLERPVLAQEDGTIYGGNQRYRAVAALYNEGWKSPWGEDMIPGRIAPIDLDLAKERALRDNNQWGEWEGDLLSDMVAHVYTTNKELVATLGFTDEELADLLAGTTYEPTDPTFDPESVNVGGGLGEPIEPEPEPDRKGGALLALTNVTIGEPTHRVEPGEVWDVGQHVLVCENVMGGWQTWVHHLETGSILAPYPGPFVPLSNRALDYRIVMVQPDPYIAGHILDRYVEQHGEQAIKKRVL